MPNPPKDLTQEFTESTKEFSIVYGCCAEEGLKKRKLKLKKTSSRPPVQSTIKSSTKPFGNRRVHEAKQELIATISHIDKRIGDHEKKMDALRENLKAQLKKGVPQEEIKDSLEAKLLIREKRFVTDLKIKKDNFARMLAKLEKPQPIHLTASLNTIPQKTHSRLASSIGRLLQHLKSPLMSSKHF